VGFLNPYVQVGWFLVLVSSAGSQCVFFGGSATLQVVKHLAPYGSLGL
jgi:hypothetical protein